MQVEVHSRWHVDENYGRLRTEWKETLIFFIVQFSSVQFSHSVMSDSSWPHELQHARPPCPSPTPGVHSDSHPSSRWCHPAISSSVVPFSSCLQSLPASESFPTSQLFTWGGQSTGVSALASFLPKKSQGWSPSEWTGWISLQPKGLSRVFSNTTLWKHQFSIITYKRFKFFNTAKPSVMGTHSYLPSVISCLHHSPAVSHTKHSFQQM